MNHLTATPAAFAVQAAALPRVRAHFLAACLFWASLAFGHMPTVAQAEIQALLDYVGSSGCEFNRNGDWHSAEVTRLHLTKKFQYLLDRRPPRNAEDFIANVATTSHLSGQPYMVRCDPGETIPSSIWLQTHLKKIRQR